MDKEEQQHLINKPLQKKKLKTNRRKEKNPI